MRRVTDMRGFASSVGLGAVLFAFWVLLSGKLDAAHLGAGAVAAALIALVTRKLHALPPAIGPAPHAPFADLRWARLLRYIPWLAFEVIVSSLHVAYVVVHPRLPIEPRVLKLKAGLPHPVARLVLANSITLTPGTVTMEVEGDEFVVHALTDASARGLEEGRMQRLVADLFGLAARPDSAGGAA